MFADFQKAFDSINHEFMFNCLKCFNFGSDIINWIKCFYNDAKSAVINSGHMTDFFYIKKGLRQGCFLSAYLCIICIELLAAAVRENKKIKILKEYQYLIKNLRVHFLQMTQRLHWMFF